MHDPMVVVWEIPSPFLHRNRFRERGLDRRWGFIRSRRTNEENRGEPVYGWWRPRGYTLAVAGRAYGLRRLATIWHVEPRGHDSGTVCKHYRKWQDADGKWQLKMLRSWKWHVWHWRIQLHFEQRLRRFLLERCEACGRRYPWGYAPVSHQWDSPKSRWRNGIVKRAYHHECSSLRMSRQTIARDEEIIRALVAYLRAVRDCSEEEIVEELTGAHAKWAEFNVRYRLQGLLGWKRDNDYRLVRSDR